MKRDSHPEDEDLTKLPDVDDLVDAAVLNIPVANQLRVGGAQVDLLIGQIEEGGGLTRTDAVGPELVEGSVFLLDAGTETGTRLRRGRAEGPSAVHRRGGAARSEHPGI